MYSLACHEGQLCLCFMALDKIDVIKNAKKNTLKQNKTTTMAKQTNKNTGPISCHLDRRNSVKKAFVMYVATQKFLLVRSKQNLFQRARQTYTSIDRLAIHHFRNKNLETGASQLSQRLMGLLLGTRQSADSYWPICFPCPKYQCNSPGSLCKN